MKKLISLSITIVLILSFIPQVYADDIGKSEHRKTIAAGVRSCAIIKEDNSLWILGSTSIEEKTSKKLNAPVKIMENVKSVSYEKGHRAVIKEDNSLWVWGNNTHGQLGNGTFEYSHHPIKIMDDVVEVSLGSDHSAAIKTDGSLWMWGWNLWGSLGNGTKDDSNTPIKIMENVKSVCLGGALSAVIKTDGSLWMWGFNKYGELGNGTFEGSNIPIKIMDDVAKVSLGNWEGNAHSAAIKNNGTLWTWGFNRHGQLGNGSYESSSTPIKIMDDVIDVSLGGFNSAAIKTDGSLWVWGDNNHGQIGKEITGYMTNTPIKIMSDVAMVELGRDFSVAIKNDSTLWSWGLNDYGQLGDGTNTNVKNPQKVMNNIMIPTNSSNQPLKAIQENNPYLSEAIPQTIGLSEEKKLTVYIAGIYSEVYKNDFSVKSSNENIIAVSEYEVNCGGISNPFDESDVTYLTSVDTYVIGKKPGNAILTYFYQGKEIGKINVTVEAVIAETISNDTILKAEMLKRNHSFELFRNTIQSPAVKINCSFRDNSTQEWANAYMFTYELSKILSLKFPDVEKFDMKSYYEAVLTDILENDNASIWSDFHSNWKSIYNGYNNKLVQEIIKSIPDFEKYKNSNLAKETDIKIVLDKIKNTKGEFKDIKIEQNLFEAFGFCYDTITDTFDVIDEVYAYSAVQQEKIDVLNAIKKNTDNAELAKACESVIERIQDVHKNVVAAFLKNEGVAVGKNLLELSQSVTIDLLLQVGKTTSAADIISDYSRGKLIMSTARLATDLIMNATSISKDTLTIAAYSDIESEIKECIRIAESNFERNKNIDNARSYIATADVFKAALLTSCDLYSKCIKDVQRGDTGIEIASIIGTMGVSGIINSIWGNDTNYDEKIKQADFFKQSIAETDFYTATGDVVEYISKIESTTPSDWAKHYVDWAIEHNILPFDYLRGNYQNNITRAEFCTLLYYTITEFTGEDASVLAEKQPYKPQIFKDTQYFYIYTMLQLGIVNGVSETEFNPLGEISREEAATMLMRAAKVTGCDISAPSTNLQGVSNWATDGVNFVVDRGIMNGTDVGFEPQGKYTKEQAITTFVRFIENLK